MAVKLKKHQVRRLNDWLNKKRKQAKRASETAWGEYQSNVNFGKQKAFDEVIAKIQEIASENEG